MNAHLGNRETSLPRAGQEIADIGIEPQIIAAHRPQAERAVGILPRQDALDGLAHALVRLVVEREVFLLGQALDVKQRQRPAHDLLRAAVRIPVERLEQPRHVEARERRDRDRHGPGAAEDIGHEILREGEACPRCNALHRPACQRSGSGLDGDGEALRQLVDIRPFQRHVDRRRALAGRRDRNGDAVLGLGLEPDGGSQGIRRHEDGTADVEFNRVVACRALHIVDLHEEAGAVADGEEPRKRAGQHHGIANDHIGARTADAVLSSRRRP